MNRIVTHAVILVLATCSVAWADGGANDESIVHQRAPLTDDVLAVASGNNQFAIDLYRQVAAGADASDNLLISPLSISTALAMTYAGARGNTAAQMADVLNFDLPDERLHAAYGGLLGDLNTQREGYELNVVNRLFGQDGFAFKQPFLNTVADSYAAPLERLDFAGDPDAARVHINDWVEDQTNDLIQDLLPQGSVHDQTRLVLTNAVYFNAGWKSKFDADDTHEATFHFADGGSTTTSLMTQENTFRYGDFEGYQMLEMPYAGDDLSMVMMLPDEADGLAAFEADLSNELLETSLAELDEQKVEVYLPKFTFDSKFGLKSALQSLGMNDAFDAAAADLTGIADAALAIDDVVHQAFIDVSEEGTEAAAATGVTVGVTNVIVPPPTPVFRADHPFLFGLRDMHTGSLMFLGRVTETDSLASVAAGTPEPSSLVLLGVGFVATTTLGGRKTRGRAGHTN